MDRKKKQSMFRAFRQFMETCMVSDGSGALHKIFAEKIFGFGTAIDEKIFGIKEVKKLLSSQQKQSKGLDIKWKIKPVSRFITADENTAVFADDLHLSIRAGKETVKMYIRFSVVLNYRNDKWKVIHWHGSKPEQVESEKDTWGVENWKQKATELERLVKEKTADLIVKNRELEIEAAVERVRAKALAMHKSEDLHAVVVSVKNELMGLQIPDVTAATIYLSQSDGTIRVLDLSGSAEGDEGKPQLRMDKVFRLEDTDPELWVRRMWNRKENYFVLEADENDFARVVHFIRTIDPADAEMAEKIIREKAIKKAWLPTVKLEKGVMNIDLLAPPTPEIESILLKMAAGFDLAYKRFLDLQKAEAQAREAQVEASLERIRSKTMAMHKSEELPEAATLLFHQMQLLGMPAFAAGYCIWDEDKQAITLWMSSEGILQPPFKAPTTEDELFIQMRKGYEDGKSLHVVEMGGEDLVAHYQYMRTLPVVGDIFNAILEAGHPLPVFQVMHYAYFSKGFLLIITYEPVPEAHDLFKRFAAVFEQTYTRFLDLQKAEEQAREGQIEAALERVRSKTMAMHNSQDVAATVITMFDELVKLGVDRTIRCGIGILKDTTELELWTAYQRDSDENVSLTLGRIDTTLHPLLTGAANAWKNNEPTFSYELADEDLIRYYTILNESPHYPFTIDISSLPAKLTHYDFYFPDGTVFAFTRQPLPPELMQIFKRFAAVFGQTYRRYLDLLKAEANAREAQIEAALERVRSKAMAMHSSQDLADTIGVFYNELKSFSITPRRCGVGLLNKENKEGELFTWNTTEQGESLELVGKIKMEGHPVLENVYSGWVSQTDYFPVLRGNEIKEYYKVIRPMMAFPDYDHDEVQYGYFFFFNEGGVYAWTQSEMQDDELQIYRRFTSVLSLTYKRYKDLQQAEALAEQARLDLIQIQTEKKRAEEALAELQSTQKQLIQSEKMASLGELTAGIAHEIQNPLNFVNNFSEVSKELLAEMKEAIEKGDTEDAKDIMKDVIQNLEKINHHGKRADGIVKGMLQHSRSSSGQKEPTDINALCDEYLRLAYHGLRAKDKSFSATMETDFDESIGNINVVPQDIGRVILNLITNAFYAVNEKKASAGSVGQGYEPTVTVNTKKINDKVEISVKDNGNGIPPKVLDKIFQPFFTTKPTGQGTGLGLSLSYDIVKAHGGELKVNTIEGEGTKFIIILNQY